MFTNWPNPDEFIYRDSLIADIPIRLVFPKHNGVTWDASNIIFRSSIWTLENHPKPVSLSFKKFWNFGEKTNLVPDPISMYHSDAIEKIDGSTLIVSWFKGERIIRTRGTLDVSSMDNAHEIEFLIKKYPKAFAEQPKSFLNAGFSTIFEWVSPENQIVVKYDEPDIYLIGVVEHGHYEYLSQRALDNLAKAIGVKRPQHFQFDSVDELIAKVTEFDDKEGVCIYYTNGQEIKKVKSDIYKAKHALKFMLDSGKNIIDLFWEMGCPTYLDFMKNLEDTYDYETAQFLIPQVSKVCDAYREYQNFYNHIYQFVENLRSPVGLTRKQQAERILNSYGDSGRSGIAFSILDNKSVSEHKFKQILLQMMK